ncbi:MAG TPA: DNA methyltransferase [Ktedonobacteraceae bacterium]|nr:DNA methyltransferase [Ktedonobacteraceae bacterium]
MPLDKLNAHPRNYRQHPEAQVSKLVSSLVRFGQGRSIVVQDGPQGYLIVAGHGIVQAATKLGYTELRADILPADWTEEQISGYLIADNMHSQEAQDDDRALAELLQEQQDAGFDLASLGTDDEYLRQLLEGLGDEYLGNEGEDEEDDFEAEPDEEQTRVKLGDVWQLGRHTIACMNATDKETYEKLLKNVDVNFVWSDPPYGIDIVATNGYVGGGEAYDIPFGGVKNRKGLGTVGGSKPFGSKSDRGSIGGANPPGSKNNLRIAPKIKAGKYAPIVGDDSIDTAIASSALCLESFPKAVQIWWGANYYAQALPHSSCWIVWDKENTGNFADAELAWCSDDSAVRIFKHMWNGLMKESEQGQRRVHPSQKPIKLAEWAFEKYGSEQDIIFDPFLGSGISVIAAENLSGERKVIGCELSPAYIDVCITRWEQLTNQQATLLDRVEEATHA